MSSHPVSGEEPAKPSRWQFRLSSLFIVMLLIGVLLPTLGLTAMFDLICVFVFATLAFRFRRRRRIAPFWTLLVIPLILLGVSTPFILLDDQLTNGWVVAEVWWCTAVLSIASGIGGGLIVREWSLPQRFYPVRFTIATMLLVAGIGLLTWMKVGYRGLPDLAVLNVHASIERSSSRGAGGAHVVIRLPGELSSPETDYIRQGRNYYWSGARVHVAGWGLFYVRSIKSGGDYSLGPFLVAVIPFWVMILGGGAGVIQYSNLRSRLPAVRFSRTTWSVMLAAFLIVLLTNIFWPRRSFHDPVLHDFGYPLRCLRVAIQHGVQLDHYMGYSLGWQLDQLMLNMLLAGVVILSAGVVVKRIFKRAN